MKAWLCRQARVHKSSRDYGFVPTSLQATRSLCDLAALYLGEHGEPPNLPTCQSTQPDMDQLYADKLNVTSLLRSHAKAKALFDGRLTHTHLVFCGYDHDIIISNCVMQMYGGCGTVTEARAIFDKLSYQNSYSFNMMINVYRRNGLLNDARDLFASMPFRDDVTWNAMIGACVEHESCEEALCLFWSMHWDGILYNNIAFVSALGACTDNASITDGQKIHSVIVCIGFPEDTLVGNALLSFYGKHKLVQEAQYVFSNMHQCDRISWTAMLSVFVKNQKGHEALSTFYMMQFKGVEPDVVAHICALDACAEVLAYDDGQVIHSALVEGSLEGNVVALTALINLYGKCHSMPDARDVFAKMPLRNVVAWTAMLAIFAHNSHDKEALQHFYRMQVEGFSPNNVTFTYAVDACTGLLSLEDGQNMHAAVVLRGLEYDVAISACLVHLYGKCRRMDDARSVFDRMSHKDVVTWSTMVTSYSQNGHGKEALHLLHDMEADGIKPNNITFVCLVEACTRLESLEEGLYLDRSICESGLSKDVILGNALLNMYGKCGSLPDAERVFRRMANHNIVSWTTMVALYAQLGHGEYAIACFEEMLSGSINPDSMAFTCVLTACSHGGLVDDGWQMFTCMVKNFHVRQTIDHFVCMIDLLGRTGHLMEAEALINEAPFQDLVVPWLCLLGASKVCGDVERGSRAAKCCLELDPQNATPYTMLGNVVLIENRFAKGIAFLELFT